MHRTKLATCPLSSLPTDVNVTHVSILDYMVKKGTANFSTQTRRRSELLICSASGVMRTYTENDAGQKQHFAISHSLMVSCLIFKQQLKSKMLLTQCKKSCCSLATQNPAKLEIRCGPANLKPSQPKHGHVAQKMPSLVLPALLLAWSTKMAKVALKPILAALLPPIKGTWLACPIIVSLRPYGWETCRDRLQF